MGHIYENIKAEKQFQLRRKYDFPFGKIRKVCVFS